jgi:hypothetical protein
MTTAILRPLRFCSVFKTSIHCQQHLKASGFSSIQKLAILQPAKTAYCADLVLKQILAESLIYTLVEQNLHSGFSREKLVGLF